MRQADASRALEIDLTNYEVTSFEGISPRFSNCRATHANSAVDLMRSPRAIREDRAALAEKLVIGDNIGQLSMSVGHVALLIAPIEFESAKTASPSTTFYTAAHRQRQILSSVCSFTQSHAPKLTGLVDQTLAAS
ncbi:MAG: hypothetical protein ABSC06_38095 [Rhodopila sp.]